MSIDQLPPEMANGAAILTEPARTVGAASSVDLHAAKHNVVPSLDPDELVTTEWSGPRVHAKSAWSRHGQVKHLGNRRGPARYRLLTIRTVAMLTMFRGAERDPAPCHHGARSAGVPRWPPRWSAPR